MPQIKLVEDIGAPLAVVVVDLVSETTQPTWNEGLAYASAVAGYLGAYTNFGGDFVKNYGIAALPWAAKKLYTRMRVGTGVSRAALRRVGRYPAPLAQPEFQGARLV